MDPDDPLVNMIRIKAIYHMQTLYRKQVLLVYDRLAYGKDRPHPLLHDDVIKWKHVPRNWPFVPGIPRSPVNSPHKGQWSAPR